MTGRHSRYIYSEVRDPLKQHRAGGKPVPTFEAILVEQSRFSCAELRRLRAERGVGPVSRVAENVRAGFEQSKR